MKIRQLRFNDDGFPEKIAVEMSIREATFITKLLGKQSGNSLAEHDLADYREENSEIYDEMTSMVFNPYWEDGVSET